MKTGMKNLFIQTGSVIILVLLIACLSLPGASHRSVNATTLHELTGEITLWYSYESGSSEETALNLVIDNVEALNPGLIITAIQKNFNTIHDEYVAEVLIGSGPDLLLTPNDWLGELAREGYIKNINTELVGKLTAFETTAVEGMKYMGSLYGVPESAKAVALYYNKLRIPDPPETTSELISLVASGKKLVIANGNAGGAYFNFGLYGAFGGQLMDATGRCIADQGGFVEAMQYLVALNNAGAVVIGDSWNEGVLKYRTGEIDFLIDGPWYLEDNRAALGVNTGVVPLPIGPSGPSLPLNGIDGFFINPISLRTADAVEVALQMVTQLNSQIFTNVGGHIPVRTDVTSVDPLINAFRLASATGLPRPQQAELVNYWVPFGEMMTEVLAGTVDPITGIRHACEEMNTLNGFPTYYVFLPAVKR